MPDGNFALFPQGVQDLEAVRLRDVFEVDRADARLQHLHELNDFVGVMLAFCVVAVHAKCDRIETAEILDQEGLAFHDSQAAGGRAVAVAQDARGIADHRDEVRAVGEFEREVVVVADRGRDLRNAGAVVNVEPIEAVQTGLRNRHHLAAVVLVRFIGQFLQKNRLPLCNLRRRKVLREGLLQVRHLEINLGHAGVLLSLRRIRIQRLVLNVGKWAG
ncbi:MAG: hypothetical protein A4E73_00273 [Syntrophaceae bacterium PtaU1.Bin231]|nr:MAG: hypothetical protein A4E73_00273 [Syntrophaceae bacterium PtaU1.Bin231]